MASEKTPAKKATFRKIPRKAQIYYISLYLTGFTLVLFFILKGAINEKNWETALLFYF